jgi:hypothetical protein
MPGQTREQRLARWRTQAERKQIGKAAELARALQRQVAMEHISHIERADVKGLEIPQDVRIYFACICYIMSNFFTGLSNG